MRTVKQVVVVKRQGEWIFLAGNWGHQLIRPKNIEQRRGQERTEVGFYVRKSKSVNAREIAYVFPPNWLSQLRESGMNIAFGEPKRGDRDRMVSFAEEASMGEVPKRRRRAR